MKQQIFSNFRKSGNGPTFNASAQKPNRPQIDIIFQKQGIDQLFQNNRPKGNGATFEKNLEIFIEKQGIGQLNENKRNMKHLEIMLIDMGKLQNLEIDN